MKTPNLRLGKPGFSLLEIMIAVAIVGMILTIIGGSLSRQMRTKEKIEAFTERLNTARIALNRMSKEISMAYLSKHYNCNEKRSQTLFKGRSGGSDELLFTSFSHYKWVQDANESDQNEISYYVKPDPEDATHLALFRKEARRITAEPGKTGKEYVFAHHIKSLHFEYYNEEMDLWQKDWDTTRSDQKFKLPLFVKIILELPWVDGKERTLSTKTRIYLRDALAFGPNVCLN